MAVSNRVFTVELRKQTVHLQLGVLGIGDNDGCVLKLNVRDSETPINLAGNVATAYMLRSDGSTVVQAGVIDGSTITVPIPEAGLAVPGRVVMAIRLTIGGVKYTPAFAEYTAKTVASTTIVDPGSVVPDINDLLTIVERVEAHMNTTSSTVAGVRADMDRLEAAFEAPTMQHVAQWLAAHPEATTTVQDGSVTIDKLHESALVSLRGKTVSPIYLGDWVTKDLPSACLKEGNTTYLFDGILGSDARDDKTCNVYIYDGDDLQEVKRAEFGHANSAACDGTYIYVVPVWEYTGDGVTASKIYRYTKDFASRTVINTPGVMMSVSYDHVAKKLYCFGYDHRIYEVRGTSVTPVTQPIDLLSDVTFNQDFAIHAGYFLVSSPFNLVLAGAIAPTPRIIGYFTVNSVDQDSRWKMGEIQGMEFGADGILYCARAVRIHSTMMNGFITALPVFSAIPPIAAKMGFSENNFTAFHVSGNQQLALQEYEIRNLNQLNAMITHPSQVRIETDADDGEVTLQNGITIDLRARLKLDSLTLYNGTFNIYTTSTDNMLDIATGRINVERSSELAFTGTSALNATGERLTVSFGYYYPLTRIRIVPNCDLYIGDVKATSRGLYCGSTRMAFTSDS